MTKTIALRTSSAAHTARLGKTLAKKLKPGAILALTGPLGSGKTTFVKGLAAGLGIRKKITSPTFVKMTRHPLSRTDRAFYHLDLYRLGNRSELIELGLSEILKAEQQDVTVIEWPEQAAAILPERTTWIHFTYDPTNTNSRIITIR